MRGERPEIDVNPKQGAYEGCYARTFRWRTRKPFSSKTGKMGISEYSLLCLKYPRDH